MLHGLSPALQPVSEHAVTGQQQQQRQQQQQEQETPDIPLHQQQKPASQSSAQETAPPPAAEEKKNSRKLPNRKTTATSTAQTAATKIKGKQKAKAQARQCTVLLHFWMLIPTMTSTAADLDEPVDRKASHKNAEQRRRDSLKECFEELRHLLPHIPPEEDEEATKRPGEGNIGGQRSSVYDPEHPNKGVSKVALLRKSNVYLQALGKRIARRDAVIQAMQTKLERAGLGLDEHDMLALDGLSLDAIDEEEYGAWPYPKVDQDELPVEPEASLSRRPSRRKMNEAAISYDKT